MKVLGNFRRAIQIKVFMVVEHMRSYATDTVTEYCNILRQTSACRYSKWKMTSGNDLCGDVCDLEFVLFQICQ